LDILDDARDLELRVAPPLGQYIRSVGTTAGAVIGLAFAFTGPVFGVVVATVGVYIFHADPTRWLDLSKRLGRAFAPSSSSPSLPFS